MFAYRELDFNRFVSAMKKSAMGSIYFADYVNEHADGCIVVEVHHNGVLGDERAMLEAATLGTLDIVATSCAPASNWVPTVSVFDLPYLFESTDAAWACIDGEIGDQIADMFQGTGMTVLNWFQVGWRNCTSTSPIKSVEDLAGVKIRVMESSVPIAVFEALGAIPTPMAWGEVYTALQQGTIDAQENPLSIIYNSKIQEVTPYINMTQHVMGLGMLMISDATLELLTEEDRALLFEAGEAAWQYERQYSNDLDASLLEKLAEEGATIVEVDKTPFIEATACVYDQFRDEFGGDLIDAIKAYSEQ